MPRGGRRPGAGAPRANLNGLRTGRSSPRLQKVYLALLLHTEPRALVADLRAAGLVPRHPLPFDPRNLKYVVACLYPRWFDCPGEGQSMPFKHDHSHPLPCAVLESLVESVLAHGTPAAVHIAAEKLHYELQSSARLGYHPASTGSFEPPRDGVRDPDAAPPAPGEPAT